MTWKKKTPSEVVLCETHHFLLLTFLCQIPRLLWRSEACSLGWALCIECSGASWCGGSSSGSPESSGVRQWHHTRHNSAGTHLRSVKTGIFWIWLNWIFFFPRQYLELWHHSDFTEAFGGWVLCSTVSEDLVQQWVVGVLQQAGELQGHWVLQVRHP